MALTRDPKGDREKAMYSGINAMIGGLGTLENQRKNERAMALEGVKYGLQLQQEGIDVSPEEMETFKELGRSGDVEGAVSLYAQKRSPIVERQKRIRELEEQKLQAEIGDIGKPYSETRAGKKLQEEYRLRSDLERQKLDTKGRYKEMSQRQESGALPKMSAETANKIGGIASAFKAIGDMENASEKGFAPRYITPETPFIGKAVSDDPFTASQRVLTEVVGRLQSGGAITKDEEERFMNMGPRPGDDSNTRKLKIDQQRAFLTNKLAAYNLSLDDLKKSGRFDLGDRYQPQNTATPIPTHYPGMSQEQKRQRLLQLRMKAQQSNGGLAVRP